jgi:hypothetical protein
MAEHRVPLSDFVEEARAIVDLAKYRGLVMRVMGAVAFRIHCPKSSELYSTLGRELSDLDFMAYKGQIKKILDMMPDIGYVSDPHTLLLRRVLGRYKWFDANSKRFLDVFFDQLEMCHTIDFRNRLEIDYPTITLADLLLEKLQVVRLTQKDMIDTIVLLREHSLGNEDNEQIDLNYITRVMSNDWGFYYTATSSLKRIHEFLETSLLPDDEKENVKAKIDTTIMEIDKAPKSSSWMKRSRIGTSKKWYREVEDI